MALARYLKVMSAPRCGVWTTGLSNTTSGWSMALSSARSCDLMKRYQRSRPGKLIRRLLRHEAAIRTGNGNRPRHIEHRADQRPHSAPPLMHIDAYAPLCIRCQGTDATLFQNAAVFEHGGRARGAG